jgi:hypothetical protein
VLGFHPVPESNITWFYNLPAAQQFLLWIKSVFLYFLIWAYQFAISLKAYSAA